MRVAFVSILSGSLVLGCTSGAVPDAPDARADVVVVVGDASVSSDQPAVVRRERPAMPTYWRDVAPILRARCQDCHVQGGIGPFALTSFAEASSVSALLAQETRTRRMPPWPPSSTCRPLREVRSLTDDEIAILGDWHAMGTPEGSRADYTEPPGAPPPLPERPDFTAQPMAPYTPPMNALDDYRCFVVDPGWTESHKLTTIRITPGESRTVHHLNVFEIKAQAVPALMQVDARDAAEGYRCFSGAGVPITSNGAIQVQFLAGWAPGTPALRTPDNTALRVDPGSRVVLQVHYNQLGGRGLPDRSKVDLYFSDQEARRIAMVVPLSANDFRIPAGAADHPVVAEASPRTLGLPLNVTVYGEYAHMHGFGRSFHTEIVRADGTRECLLDIPRWSFHWQQFYMLNEPVRVGADDRMRVECRYDNSATNQPEINGVTRTPQEVREGTGTLDEMCFGFFYVTFF